MKHTDVELKGKLAERLPDILGFDAKCEVYFSPTLYWRKTTDRHEAPGARHCDETSLRFSRSGTSATRWPTLNRQS